MDERAEKMLTTCYEEHKTNWSSHKIECCENLRPYLPKLKTCNCFHHFGEYLQMADVNACKGIPTRDFLYLLIIIEMF